MPKIKLEGLQEIEGTVLKETETETTTTYIYNYIVPSGNGTQTISLIGGVDKLGYDLLETPLGINSFKIINDTLEQVGDRIKEIFTSNRNNPNLDIINAVYNPDRWIISLGMMFITLKVF